MKVVIDTNVLLMAVPKDSKYRSVFDGIIYGKIRLVFTNDILLEYIEKIEEKSTSAIARNIGEFLLNSRYVDKIEVFYRWNLISRDPDDNKFVDCAIAGNVKYIVSNDKHFNELKSIGFPIVEVIKIDDFMKVLEKL